jgi:hypothetical protein
MDSAFEALSRLSIERKSTQYPNVPPHYLLKPQYSDKTANELTKCILDYIQLLGGYAVRINTQGQYNEKLQQWTKGTTARGTADIHACIEGRHFSIEVKVGKDRMSQYQLEVRQQVEQASGYYYVASTFPAFYEWLNNLIIKN